MRKNKRKTYLIDYLFEYFLILKICAHSTVRFHENKLILKITNHTCWGACLPGAWKIAMELENENRVRIERINGINQVRLSLISSHENY